MSIQRPGRLEITDRAMELWQLPKGAAVLDVGCGDGTAARHLQEKYGYKVTGIDLNLERINAGKKQDEALDLRVGDGEFLDEFPSFSFDGVMMECSLSLMNQPDEALHEAYCVLKKGGRLLINDLYHRNPDPGQLQAVAIEARRQARIPHKEGACDHQKERFVDFRLQGAFFAEPLTRYLAEIGYIVRTFEDRSDDLHTYVAETILQEGSLEDCFTCVKDITNKKDIGYFLLTAEKPL